MRLLAIACVLAAGCAARQTPAEPPVDERDAPGPEPVTEADAVELPAEADASTIDFSSDVGGPSAAVDAQPERRPSGAFELCGDKCRDNVQLMDSFPDETAEPEPTPAEQRKARRRERRQRRRERAQNGS